MNLIFCTTSIWNTLWVFLEFSAFMTHLVFLWNVEGGVGWIEISPMLHILLWRSWYNNCLTEELWEMRQVERELRTAVKEMWPIIVALRLESMMAIKLVKCAKCERLIAFAHFQLICVKFWKFIWNSLEPAEIKNVDRAFCGLTPSPIVWIHLTPDLFERLGGMRGWIWEVVNMYFEAVMLLFTRASLNSAILDNYWTVFYILYLGKNQRR